MSVRFLTDKDAVIQYTKQDLTEEQKAQARENIGVGAGSNVEPAEDDIPKVFFGGALPQTKDAQPMSFRYVSKTMDISGYCETKAQGNSSMAFPKKNQTVKLYKDAACTEKLKVDFKGWGKQNKFCFKANWIDLTHARNVVSARLWGDVVKSRANYETIPELLRTSPNQGAVDGFPVKVYADGVYQGRYTINIPKDAWMANMDKDLDNHCILCGENYESGCFRSVAKIDGTDWTDEVHDTVPTSIKTWWNHAIDFVMTSSDEGFRTGLGMYFDVDSLIDYYLFGLASCGLDAFGKNQLYMTYDGLKWYATMYDMDSTWGLYFDGSYFVSDTYARNSYQDFADGDGNLLYIRLEALFADAIMARWEELKNGVLSVENIINAFERFTDIAPPYLVAEDYANTTAGGAFNAIPQQGANNIQQLRDYIVKRWSYVDGRISVLNNEYAYRLTEPMVFDGTNRLNTYVKPFAEPKDFTVMVAFDTTNEQNYDNGNEPTLLTLDGYNDIQIRHGGNGYWAMMANGQKQVLETDSDGSWGHSWERTKVIIAVFKQGVFTFGKYYLNHTEKIYNIPATAGNTFTARPTTNMFVGVRDPWSSKPGYWKGTVNDLRVFNYALSEEDVTSLINEIIVGAAPPSEPSDEPLYPLNNGTVTLDASWGGKNMATVTVSNGNHVRIEDTDTAANTVNINLHDITANKFIMSDENFVHDPVFVLHAGDKLLVKKINTVINTTDEAVAEKTHSIFFRKGDGSSASSYVYPGCALNLDVENEQTIESEFTVGCIGLYMQGLSSTSTIEFDLEIYVNGVRYV